MLYKSWYGILLLQKTLPKHTTGNLNVLMPESLLSYSFEKQAPSGIHGLLCSYLLQVASYILLPENILQDTVNTADVQVVWGLWAVFLYCLWIILLSSLFQKNSELILRKFHTVYFLIPVLSSQIPFKCILFSPTHSTSVFFI